MAIAPLPSPLEARIQALPLVIAGPILRLVEANQIVVWIALKAARTAHPDPKVAENGRRMSPK